MLFTLLSLKYHFHSLKRLQSEWYLRVHSKSDCVRRNHSPTHFYSYSFSLVNLYKHSNNVLTPIKLRFKIYNLNVSSYYYDMFDSSLLVHSLTVERDTLVSVVRPRATVAPSEGGFLRRTVSGPKAQPAHEREAARPET